MKKEEIHLGDIERIVLGQAPLEFMAEVLVRTAVIYLALLIVLRLLGKRMNAQLTITELAVMITLGAIVAVPMQIPDRGLLPSIVVLLCVLVLQRGLSYLTVRSRAAEVAVHGDVTLLVQDGVLQTDELKKAAISHEQLFAQIRSHDVVHLGQVKRVYLEGGGHFSVFKNPEPKPGLSVLPLKDKKLHKQEGKASGQHACLHCATVVDAQTARGACPTCGHEQWTHAVAETSPVAAEA
ncbi:DUF421 domain-containing protein [Solirubrum puertoriconensis]|nr:YetF domain-containing protein [Solirubrum puertoriconensis]